MPFIQTSRLQGSIKLFSNCCAANNGGIQAFQKREREVTGDSPLGGTGCRHGLKMSSFVIGNALQCLEIRFSRLSAHSSSCWAQVTLTVSLWTSITETFSWITASHIHRAFQQLTWCPKTTPRSVFSNYKSCYDSCLPRVLLPGPPPVQRWWENPAVYIQMAPLSNDESVKQQTKFAIHLWSATSSKGTFFFF